MIQPTKYVEYHSQDWLNLTYPTVRINGLTWAWITWEVFDLGNGIQMAKMIYTSL